MAPAVNGGEMKHNEGAKGKALKTVPPIAHPTPDDAFGVAANIQYHAQYGPHFSPFKFEPEQAFYATAESVRDSLIQVRPSTSSADLVCRIFFANLLSCARWILMLFVFSAQLGN